MKAFVLWVLARRHWLILMAIAFAPTIPFLTTALMVLDTTKHGPARALTAAIIGLAGLTVLALMTGGNAPIFVLLGALAMPAGVAMGGMFRWAGSLNLAFQSTVLGAMAVAVGAAIFVPDVAVLVRPTLTAIVDMVREGGMPTERIELISALDPEFVWGLMLAGMFVNLVGALFLGCWWYSLAEPETYFGIQFRALRLGRVLGIASMVVVTAGLVSDAALIQNLIWIALFSFLFQGLAVMHAWGHAKHWHPGLFGLAYVAFVTPISVVLITVLSAIGLLDNVFALRSRLRG